MPFNSITFILFFSIVIFLYSLPLSWRMKKTNLLIASYIFYSAWNPVFVVLLWATTIMDWVTAAQIEKTGSRPARQALLIASMTLSLGLLAFFKYGQFLLDNFVSVLGLFHLEYQPAKADIILPVGISFYTFQSMSYTIDVYRKKIKPAPSFLDFALYVTFFPQLGAGPIIRSQDLIPQFLEPKKLEVRRLGFGLALLIIGIFQKDIFADLLMAPVADKVFAHPDQLSPLAAWMGGLGFSAQIFFDFAGYSTCAIGAAMCLGFWVGDNFRSPYAAVGFREFWRRWHISLSTWLRDYLYISLGGNRKGRRRAWLNMLATMLIGGLWHGASWRFVAWGGLHWVYLMAERAARALFRNSELAARPVFRLLLGMITYLLVVVAWVFFRAKDFNGAAEIIAAMLGGGGSGFKLPLLDYLVVLGVTIGLLTWHWLMRDLSFAELADRAPWWLWAIVLAAMMLTLALQTGDNRAFIYFQF